MDTLQDFQLNYKHVTILALATEGKKEVINKMCVEAAKGFELAIIQKVRSLRRGGGGVSLKNEQKGTGKGVLACVYVRGPVFPIDHNEDRFFCTLLLCATFRSFLCTVHYFLCTLSAKIDTYSLVTSDAYFVINSYLYYYSNPCLKALE